MATRQERREPCLELWGLGLRSLRKDAGRLRAIHLLGHTPPPPL